MTVAQGTGSAAKAAPPLVPLIPVPGPRPAEMQTRRQHSRQADNATGPVRDTTPRDDLTDLSEELSGAEQVRDVVGPVMRWVAPDLSRCILFRVTAGVATICDSRGIPAAPKELGKLRFDVAAEPVFKLLFGEPSYKGPLPAGGKCDGFYATLGIEPAGEVLIVPGYVNDALTAILYGDVPRGKSIRRSMEEYRRLTRKLALGLTLVGLRREIRSA